MNNPNEAIRLASDPETKLEVARLVYRLTPNPWNFLYLRYLLSGHMQQEGWFNVLTALYALTRWSQPKVYLEVGVHKGASLTQVLTQSPETQVYGFDLWPPDYAVQPDWPIPHVASSPDFVRNELRRVGIDSPRIEFTGGDSQHTLPKFFQEHPGFRADLALVDGDHSEEGARRDLDQVWPHVDALVFDDILHPLHPYLEKVWDDVFTRHGKRFMQWKSAFGVGTAIAIKC